jgi:hypothetical protein
MGLRPHRIQVSSPICVRPTLHGVVLRNFCSESSTSSISMTARPRRRGRKHVRTRTAHGENRDSGATSVVNRAESAGGWYFPPRDRRNGRARQVVKPASPLVLPRTSWPLCSTVSWARSLTCNRRRVRRAGAEERLPPRTASRQLMPSSWRTLLNAGYRSSPHPMRLHPRTMGLQCLRLKGRR